MNSSICTIYFYAQVCIKRSAHTWVTSMHTHTSRGRNHPSPFTHPNIIIFSVPGIAHALALFACTFYLPCNNSSLCLVVISQDSTISFVKVNCPLTATLVLFSILQFFLALCHSFCRDKTLTYYLVLDPQDIGESQWVEYLPIGQMN